MSDEEFIKQCMNLAIARAKRIRNLRRALRQYRNIKTVLSWGYEEEQDAGEVARDALRADTLASKSELL